MPSGDRISFQDILKDIRSGMSQIRLLEKYHLSPRHLLRTFDKLIKPNGSRWRNIRTGKLGRSHLLMRRVKENHSPQRLLHQKALK